MRAFTKDVFEGFVEGTTERFSHADDNALLGAAEALVFQIRVGKASGTSPTVLVKLYHSNDTKDWFPVVTLVSTYSLAIGTTYVVMADTTGYKLGAYVRVGVTLGGTTPAAEVEILACGRAEHGGA